MLVEKNKIFFSWQLDSDEIGNHSGLQSLLEEEAGQKISESAVHGLFNDAELDHLKNELRNKVKKHNNAPFRHHTMHKGANGENIVIEWQGEVIEWDQKGSPLQVVGQAKRKEDGPVKKDSFYSDSFFLERIMDNLTESIFFKDRDGKFIRINQACADKFGLEKPEDAVGKTDFDIFEEAHARPAYEDEQHILITEQAIFNKVEREIFNSTGEVKWASTSKLPLYDRNGFLIGTFGITRDVTRQVEAEQRLKRNDLIINKLSEQVPGFFYLYHHYEDGRAAFPFASSGIRDIYELEPEDVAHGFDKIYKVLHPLDRDRVVRSIQYSVHALKDWKYDFRVILPEKGERWLRGHAKPEKQADRSVIGYGYVTDITEYKNIIESNSKLRKQFESVFDAVPNLIFVKDENSRYLIANKAYCEFHGVSEEEIVGKTDEQLGVSKEEAEHYCRSDKEVLEHGKTIYIPEVRAIGKDGVERWYQTIKKPFELEGNDSKAILAIVTDISALKNKEQELSESLNIIGEQNKRLMNFAHIVSHNLRNHVGNISMLLSLYEMEDDEAEREEVFGYMKSASERLNESINDLNQIIDQQYKTQDQKKEVNLREYIANTKQVLMTEILAHNVQFNIDVPEDLSFDYNPAYLESIVLNMMSNAIKYRDPNRRPEVSMKAWKEEDGRVFFTVSDNGLGIDMEKHGDKLFGMYKTFHGNENSKGIGLFITKNQIESMGGSIEAESEPGKGTTFKINLL